MVLSLDSLSEKQLGSLVSAFVSEGDARHCLLDRDSRLVWASDHFLKVYEGSVRQIISAQASEVFGGSFFERSGKGFIERALSGERVSGEVWIDVAHRSRRSLFVSIIPVSLLADESEGSHLLWIERDLARSNASEESLEAQRRLRECEEKERKSKQTKSRFLSVMNHELRTPLNSIIGPIEMLEQVDLGPDEKQLLGLVRPAAENLLELINDLLKLSKIETGDYEVMLEVIDPAAFLEERVSSFVAQAEKKAIKFDLMVDDRLPDRIQADPYALTQILSNLIDNALRFSTQGSLVRVLFDLNEEGDEPMLLLSVEDFGCGVVPDQIEQIFEPFHRVRAESKGGYRRLRGSGLGLSICRDLARELKGDVSVFSEEGKGSVFTLSIPLVEAPAPLSDALGEGVPSADLLKMDGLKLLLVEDDLKNRAFMKLLLDRYTLEVDVAKDGEEAMGLLEVKAFDIVILDIGLPGVSGYELSKKVRAIQGDEVRVIACTAYSDEPTREQILSADFDLILKKPVSLHAFEEALTTAVRGTCSP